MESTKKTAVYAGSFDPLTKGHLWVIEQGLYLFDRLVVAVGTNPDKNYAFSEIDRMRMIAGALSPLFPYILGKVLITSLGSLLAVDFAKKHGAQFLLRGLR